MKRLLMISIFALIIVFGLLYQINSSVDKQLTTTQKNQIDRPLQNSDLQEHCTPTFADGGGPYYLPNSPFRSIIHPAEYTGEKLVIAGKVLRNDCATTAPGVVIDIWQADENGQYVDGWYRGRIRTNDEGTYEFETVKPLGYGEGTGYRPPHIHFKIFENEKELITSQMFFPETQGTPGFDDAYIMSVETIPDDDSPVHFGYHDIILP